MDLTDKIVEISQLKAILGYKDERSILRWCKLQNIPIIKLGLKKYFLLNLIIQSIENQVVIFAKTDSADLKTGPITTDGKVKKWLDSESEIVKKYAQKYENYTESSTAKKR